MVDFLVGDRPRFFFVGIDSTIVDDDDEEEEEEGDDDSVSVLVDSMDSLFDSLCDDLRVRLTNPGGN